MVQRKEGRLLMLKKVLLFFALIMFVSANCSAGPYGENNPAVLEDLHTNPSNYIICGGASTGITYYIYKNSIHVDQYAPPNYIISLKICFYANNGMRGENLHEVARYINMRYKYNYSERKIYVERFDKQKNSYWDYIDPKIINTFEGYKKGWDTDMAAAEIAFYLSYNMSFYDKPVSKSAESYIKR